MNAVVRWLAWAGALNLAWETLQIPLYTIYETGSPSAIAYALIHCTAGDVLKRSPAIAPRRS